MTDSSRIAWRARWVFPGDGEPLENATVETVGGRIAAVHTLVDPTAVDLGNVALIPALVNAHTHLEFSGLAVPLEPSRPFARWIETLVAHRRNRSDPLERLLETGAGELVATGTGLAGEIATDDRVPELIPPGVAGAVVFREILGLAPERSDDLFAVAERFLAASDAPGVEPAPIRIRGVSPHSPYTVHPDLYRRLVDLAADRRAPVAIHLAETLAERELLADGTGELVEMLQRFGVWRDGLIAKGTRPLDYLIPLEKVERALAVHGNHLDADEKAFLASHPHVALVYCPRTHAYFGHPLHPWRELLERGASVALGTDSRASNPDLSLWEEVRFLRRWFPDVPPRTLLELGTLRGARALGVEGEFGTLSEGKRAHAAVVQLAERDADPWNLLLESRDIAPLAGILPRGEM